VADVDLQFLEADSPRMGLVINPAEGSRYFLPAGPPSVRAKHHCSQLHFVHVYFTRGIAMRTAQYRDERIRLCPSVCPLPYLEDHSKLHTKFSVFFLYVLTVAVSYLT